MGANTTVKYESTPNPSTYKFLFSQDLVTDTKEFNSPQEAEISPLASKIFGFPWTAKVYLGHDFVAVTKQDWVNWEVLAEPLTHLIQEHIESGEALLMEIPETTSEEEILLDPLSLKIRSAIKAEIQPVVALDGGEIVFHSYKDGVVFIKMQGSCSGCPSSTATLKDGIEVRLRELFPEIKEVVAI
jgi:Fe-S cluster biogenesis protein NfuA